MSRRLLEEIKTMTVEESAALFLQRFQLPGTPQDVMRDMNGMMARHYRLGMYRQSRAFGNIWSSCGREAR
jgi:hypothetical protein